VLASSTGRGRLKLWRRPADVARVAKERQGTWNGCAALGAAAIIFSLWLPWYGFRIPDSILSQAEALARSYGALGPLIEHGAEIARSLGPLHVDAWQAFSQTDVALMVLAVVAGGLALLSATGRASGVAGALAGAGAVAAVITLHRILSPPGPTDLLHPLLGAYLALGGSVLVLAGGLRSRDGAGAEVEEWSFAGEPAGGVEPAAWSAARSTPPPSV
jgi:hypothetical protein